MCEFVVDADAAAEKEGKVKQDILNLQEMFAYIDKVTRRIGSSIQRDLKDAEIKRKNESKKKKKQVVQKHKGRHYDDSDSSSIGASIDEDLSLHWEDYEGMNEVERGKLLERAIKVLTVDNNPDKNKYSDSRNKYNSKSQRIEEEEEEDSEASELS